MSFGPLVSADWLAEHLDDVRLVDARWYLDPARSGRAEYEAGHLPGAVFLDIDTDLADPTRRPAEGRHPLPSPQQFAAVLGRVGIAAGDPVVAYDDVGGSYAARLWWLLHVLDEPAAILDGGLQAWTGQLTTEQPAPAPVERPARDWPAARFVGADDLASHAVLDARAVSRYTDGDPVVDPRPGHIPGALSLPWAGNLDEHDRFRTPEALRERYAGVPGEPVAVYCGSGVTACHDLLALELAGRTDTALYPGSWSQWGADASRPAVTGPDPR